MRTTIAAVGALCALAACTDVSTPKGVAGPVTRPTEPVGTSAPFIDDAAVDQEATVDEISLEIAWSNVSASDRDEMCDGYHTLTEDQFLRLARVYAPEIDANAFHAFLEGVC